MCFSICCKKLPVTLDTQNGSHRYTELYEHRNNAPTQKKRARACVNQLLNTVATTTTTTTPTTTTTTDHNSALTRSCVIHHPIRGPSGRGRDACPCAMFTYNNILAICAYSVHTVFCTLFILYIIRTDPFDGTHHKSLTLRTSRVASHKCDRRIERVCE